MKQYDEFGRSMVEMLGVLAVMGVIQPEKARSVLP